MKVDLDDEKAEIGLEKSKKTLSNTPNPLGLVSTDYYPKEMKPQEEITNWQKVLIYLDENKDKHFTDQIADLMEIYKLTNK
jgi:hypothetical protein